MASNYPEILQGTEKHMFYCPTAFNFDSRVQATETSVPDVLEKLQHSLVSKKNLTKIEQANLKAIRNHLTKLRPQLAEQEFVDALACFFYQHRGIFIHSLKLDEHLKVLVDTARLHRRANKDMGFELTNLEKKLAKKFNISEQGLIDFADDFTNRLLALPKVSGSSQVNGRVIHSAIDDQFKSSHGNGSY